MDKITDNAIDVSDLDLFDVEIVETSSYMLLPETGATCCSCCTACCSVVVT
jgi:hypothetical protein